MLSLKKGGTKLSSERLLRVKAPEVQRYFSNKFEMESNAGEDTVHEEDWCVFLTNEKKIISSWKSFSFWVY